MIRSLGHGMMVQGPAVERDVSSTAGYTFRTPISVRVASSGLSAGRLAGFTTIFGLLEEKVSRRGWERPGLRLRIDFEGGRGRLRRG